MSTDCPMQYVRNFPLPNKLSYERPTWLKPVTVIYSNKTFPKPRQLLKLPKYSKATSQEPYKQQESQYLPEGVFFVEGVKNSALYDTRVGKVYALNASATKQLKQSKLNLDFLGEVECIKVPKQAKEKSRFIWFEITNRCNLRCSHCYIGNQYPVQPKSKKMKYLDWLKAIDESRKLGFNKAQFIGGEPLLYSDSGKNIFDLMMYAKEAGFEYIEIFTNAQYITAEVADKLKELGVCVATSLYSVDNKVHDSVTGVKGSCRRTKYAIKLLTNRDIQLRVAVVLMSINEGTIPQTMQYLRELGIECRNPDPVRPTGSGKDGKLVPSKEALEKYYYFDEPRFSTSLEEFFQNSTSNVCLGRRMVLKEGGEVLPCVFARDTVLGNFKKNSLEEILNGKEAETIKSLTKDRVYVCQDCEFRYACHDCRPLSLAVYGNIHAPNPRCTYNPYTGTWGEGHWIKRSDYYTFVDIT